MLNTTPLMPSQTIMARLLVSDDDDLHNIEAYDPSAGTGTLLMALAHRVGKSKCTNLRSGYFPTKQQDVETSICFLNGLVSSLDHAIQGDTLVSPYHKNDEGSAIRQFDYVVSNPPFKMDFPGYTRKDCSPTCNDSGQVYQIFRQRKKESMAIYTCFIQHVINSLKKTGKGAIVIPTGFITAKSGIENKT